MLDPIAPYIILSWLRKSRRLCALGGCVVRFYCPKLRRSRRQVVNIDGGPAQQREAGGGGLGARFLSSGFLGRASVGLLPTSSPVGRFVAQEPLNFVLCRAAAGKLLRVPITRACAATARVARVLWKQNRPVELACFVFFVMGRSALEGEDWRSAGLPLLFAQNVSFSANWMMRGPPEVVSPWVDPALASVCVIAP